MAKPKSRVFFELFLVPIIVGIIVAIFSFGLPRLFKESKELSYTSEEPIAYLTVEQIGDLDVQINRIQTYDLYAHKIRIWNSGDLPLNNLKVRVVFDTKRKDFKIFHISHATTPKYEFGEINEEVIDDHSRRISYELLNKTDEDNITILTNMAAQVKVYGKLERLKLKYVEPSAEFLRIGKDSLFVPLLSIAAALLGLLLRLAFAWRAERKSP